MLYILFIIRNVEMFKLSLMIKYVIKKNFIHSLLDYEDDYALIFFYKCKES